MLGMEPVPFIFALIGGFFVWTVTVVGLTLYLQNKFRDLEVAFYRGLGKHRKEIDRVLAQHTGRIQRLEIMVAGSSLDPYIGPSLEHADEE